MDLPGSPLAPFTPGGPLGSAGQGSPDTPGSPFMPIGPCGPIGPCFREDLLVRASQGTLVALGSRVFLVVLFCLLVLRGRGPHLSYIFGFAANEALV